MPRPKKGPAGRADGHNAVADRAIEILLSFTNDSPILTANELREANGMSRSTIYRYLTSLRSTGLVAEEPGKGFKLGPKLIEMARIARQGNSILEIADPFIRELAEECGEVVQLIERVGRQTIILDVIESRHKIGITYLRGQILPSPAGASAKVLIAFAPPDEIDELLGSIKLQPYTPNSIVDPEVLREQLELVRKNGYAFNDEELDEGIRAVAAPIVGRSAVRYSVSIVGPSFRLTDEKLPGLIAMVKATAAKISHSLRQHEM